MHRFPTERDAKEFLVAEIVHEANRQGSALAEIERKMLFFSESGWTLPDIADVVEEFERQYKEPTYERKIAGLIRAARRRAGKDGAAAWSEAVKRLAAGDHYLLVMIDQAGVRRSGSVSWRAVVAVLGILGAWAAGQFVWAGYLGHDPGRDEQAFFVWAAAMALAGLYVLLRLAFGARVVDGFLGRVSDWVLKPPRK